MLDIHTLIAKWFELSTHYQEVVLGNIDACVECLLDEWEEAVGGGALRNLHLSTYWTNAVPVIFKELGLIDVIDKSSYARCKTFLRGKGSSPNDRARYRMADELVHSFEVEGPLYSGRHTSELDLMNGVVRMSVEMVTVDWDGVSEEYVTDLLISRVNKRTYECWALHQTPNGYHAYLVGNSHARPLTPSEKLLIQAELGCDPMYMYLGIGLGCAIRVAPKNRPNDFISREIAWVPGDDAVVDGSLLAVYNGMLETKAFYRGTEWVAEGDEFVLRRVA